MTLRQYLGFMAAGTALSWSAVVLMLLAIDPSQAHAVIIAVFFLGLFLALTGTLTLLGFSVRFWLLRKDFLVSRLVLVSFRQAVLLAALMISALYLQSRSLLSVFNAVLMVAAMTLLEFFFISVNVKRQQ